MDARRRLAALLLLLCPVAAACRVPGRPAGRPPAAPAPPGAPLPTGLGPLRFPVPGGTIVGGFGWAERAGRPVFIPYLRIDPPAGGTGSVAVAAGTVAAVHDDPALAGLYVVVRHAGAWSSLYGGCAAVTAGVGARLRAGTPVCAAARDSPLVFGLLFRGEPVNPRPYLVRP